MSILAVVSRRVVVLKLLFSNEFPPTYFLLERLAKLAKLEIEPF